MGCGADAAEIWLHRFTEEDVLARHIVSKWSSICLSAAAWQIRSIANGRNEVS